MGKKNKNTRMSIDVNEHEHKRIKMRAAKEGISIRKFIMGCVESKIIPDKSSKEKEPSSTSQ